MSDGSSKENRRWGRWDWVFLFLLIIGYTFWGNLLERLDAHEVWYIVVRNIWVWGLLILWYKYHSGKWLWQGRSDAEEVDHGEPCG
jgi:hypothetical protein